MSIPCVKPRSCQPGTRCRTWGVNNAARCTRRLRRAAHPTVLSSPDRMSSEITRVYSESKHLEGTNVGGGDHVDQAKRELTFQSVYWIENSPTQHILSLTYFTQNSHRRQAASL